MAALRKTVENEEEVSHKISEYRSFSSHAALTFSILKAVFADDKQEIFSYFSQKKHSLAFCLNRFQVDLS